MDGKVGRFVGRVSGISAEDNCLQEKNIVEVGMGRPVHKRGFCQSLGVCISDREDTEALTNPSDDLCPTEEGVVSVSPEYSVLVLRDRRLSQM